MNRTWRRRLVFAALTAASLAVPAALAWPGLAATVAAGPRTLSASSVATLSTAVAQARPGDRIVVADGTYAAPVRITRSGTAAAPITIACAGTCRITGADGLRLAGVSHVVVEGFTFAGDGALDVPAGASAVRITRNTFASNHTGAFLSVAADTGDSLPLTLPWRILPCRKSCQQKGYVNDPFFMPCKRSPS